MKKFALFYQVDYSGKLAPLLGSDCYIPIDGRLSLDNAVKIAQKHVQSLRNVKPCILAFQIRNGNIKHSKAVSGFHLVEGKNENDLKDALSKGVVKW